MYARVCVWGGGGGMRPRHIHLVPSLGLEQREGGSHR